MGRKRFNVDIIHKTGVIVLVFGEVGVGMTRVVHTKSGDDVTFFT